MFCILALFLCSKKHCLDNLICFLLKFNSHFADFEQVEKIKTSQKLALQNSLRRNWMPEQLSGLLIHVTGTPPWLLRSVKVSTSSELYPDCFWLPAFLDCSGIQFLIHLLFLTQSVRLPLVTYPWLYIAYMIYKMPCYASGQQALPTQPLPREAEDFSRDGNHSKHVPLPQYLAWLQPICYNSYICIYTCQDWRSFTCGEDFNKKHSAAATLISSHESRN